MCIRPTGFPVCSPGEVKEELTVAMGLATEAEGSLQQVLRRGVKTSTWYEDDYDQEASHEWRL